MTSEAGTEEQKMDRGTKMMIGIGAFILIVPTVAVLTMSDAAFRQQCKAKCNPEGQSYRVENVGGGVTSSGQVIYPARCYCIAPEQRTVWEKLRDAF